MPDGLARSTHAHGQRQHGEFHAASGKLGKKQLVATHPREVVNVAGFGHSDPRMDEQIGLDFVSGTERQVHMGAVHGVASLKRNYTSPAQTRKFGAQFGGSKT